MQTAVDAVQAGESAVLHHLRERGYEVEVYARGPSAEIQAVKDAMKLLIRVRAAIAPRDPDPLDEAAEMALRVRSRHADAVGVEARVQLTPDGALAAEIEWRLL